MSSTWEEMRLSDIASFTYGKLPQKSHLGCGSYPVFSGYSYQGLYPESNCSKGDLILVARGVGGTGDVKIVSQDCFLTNLSILMNFNKNITDNIFLFYFFKNENMRYLDSGSAQSQITIKDLENASITIPSLLEQRAIAAVLSNLDDKIDLLQRQNATLEAMAEALFRKAFPITAGERNNKIKIGNLFDICSGKGLKKEAFLENGAYPVLGANGKIGTTNEFLYDEKIIYTGRVGTLGNIFTFYEKAWYSDNTLVCTDIKYFYFTYFLLKFLHLEDYNVGSTQPLIRQSDIKNIEIFLPHKNKIEKFENTAEMIFAKIRSNQTQIRTLEKLRDSLLPKLMSGEVCVSLD